MSGTFVTKDDITDLVTKASADGWKAAIEVVLAAVAETAKTVELGVMAAGGTADAEGAAYLKGLLTACQAIEEMVRKFA